MKRRNASRLLVALLTGLLLVPVTGCYRYATLETGAATLQQGDRMQVSLKDPISVDLGDITVDDAVLIRGEFIGQEDDGTLLMSTASAVSVSGIDRLGDGQTTRVPADVIASVDKRVLNAVSTALVAIPLVGGALAIGAVALGDSDPSESGEGPPPSKE